MGREPGPRVTNLGAPYSATHASPGTPEEPLPLAFPVPSPTPRALADTYRPGRCPSTGPALRASGPAPTWRRRSERAGVGRRPGPLGQGGQGKGWGKVRRCLSCRRRRRLKACGKGAAGLVGESRLRSSRRCVRRRQQPPKAALVPSLSVGSWDRSGTC